MERCQRNPRCVKGAGHSGWCRTKPGHDELRSQDDLFAAQAGAGVKRARRTAGASRVAAMQELGRKRDARQGRRPVGRIPSDEDAEDDDDDDDDDNYAEDDDWGGIASSSRGRGAARTTAADDGVEYADYGLSRSERKALRERGRSAVVDDDDDDEESGAAEVEWSGPPASLADLESIRLKRSVLEKWLLEPFFAALVPGCLVRIGLQIADQRADGAISTLYRAAEVLEARDLHDNLHPPYQFAGKITRIHLRLEFGDTQQW